MSDVVIRAEGLGKKYVIGHQSAERPDTLRDMLAQQVRGLLRSARDMAAGRALITGDEREEYWALKDVNFEIKRGEVVGIIGRNGAGKSTLLKVLSRITEPTEGKVTIDGRVASLLEVGTGFHPELTGRENIYLNGAILGMTRSEIRRKFDEIVDFAGVEKFLDTPVKRYSSGMYVRLAFSVAAHLEPEILVVDEVLAVGDAEFQRKCLGKMQDVAGQGRTVLFVSHNMATIKALCSGGMHMRGGHADGTAEISAAIAEYLQNNQAGIVSFDDFSKFNCQYVRISRVELMGNEFQVSGELLKKNSALTLAVCVSTQDDIELFWSSHRDQQDMLQSVAEGSNFRLSVRLPLEMMNTGRYKLYFSAYLHNQEFLIKKGDIPFLAVEKESNEQFQNTDANRRGLLAPALAWRIVTEDRITQIQL